MKLGVFFGLVCRHIEATRAHEAVLFAYVKSDS
jgi:hypothetical protein